jgi:hypothetical protein
VSLPCLVNNVLKYNTELIFSLSALWRRIGEAEVCLHSLWTLALVGGGWSTLQPGRSTPGKELRYPLNKRLGGPQIQSGPFWRNENVFACARTQTPVRSRVTIPTTGSGWGVGVIVQNIDIQASCVVCNPHLFQVRVESTLSDTVESGRVRVLNTEQTWWRVWLGILKSATWPSHLSTVPELIRPSDVCLLHSYRGCCRQLLFKYPTTWHRSAPDGSQPVDLWPKATYWQT